MTSPNLVLTTRCLNRCRYCFAAAGGSSANRRQITGSEFGLYANLLKRSGCREVRLLGGEPFLHPSIGSMISAIQHDRSFDHLTIFTTGFVPRQYWEMLADPRVNLVVNVNEPRDYPNGGRFQKLIRILESMADAGIEYCHRVQRVPLGFRTVFRSARCGTAWCIHRSMVSGGSRPRREQRMPHAKRNTIDRAQDSAHAEGMCASWSSPHHGLPLGAVCLQQFSVGAIRVFVRMMFRTWDAAIR